MNYCTETQLCALDSGVSKAQFPFRLLLLMSCLLTTNSMWIIFSGLPEIVMYSITFSYIKRSTNQTAVSGILRPEIIKKRRKQNTLNLIMTFWTWLVQFITNILCVVVMKLFFGKDRYFQTLFATFLVFLNFNILPLFYVALADNEFKTAIMNRDFRSIVNIFIDFTE